MSKIRFFKLAVIVFLLFQLTGCTDGDSIKLDPNNPVAIVIWHYYHGVQKTAFDNAVKEFNETVGYDTGIIVEAVSYGGVAELAENVAAAARGKLDSAPMPDVFSSYGDTALEILNLGMVAEINDYLSEEEISEYYDAFIKEGMLGTDKLYVFPIAKATESLMLNKTDFDKFAEELKTSGLNETVSYEELSTWEGILRVADIYYRYTEATQGKGKAFAGIDELANYLIIGAKQLGTEIVQVEDGNAVFDLDEDVMWKLWSTYYEGMVTGRFAKLGRFCSDDIKTGDSLCFIGSTSSANYFPSSLVTENGVMREIELMVLPMPVFENGDKVAVSQGAGMVISKSLKEKEYASAIFLKWFTEAERNVNFSIDSTYLPVRKESLNADVLNEAFDKNGDLEGMENSVRSLRTAFEQLKTYALYSTDIFEGGADFRSKLPKGMKEAVQRGREEYLTLIQNGLSKESAFSELLENSREQFKAWLENLEE